MLQNKRILVTVQQVLNSYASSEVKLVHPNSPAVQQNILFWHGLRGKCADLLSSYDFCVVKMLNHPMTEA